MQVESGIARLRAAVKDIYPLATGRHRPSAPASIRSRDLPSYLRNTWPPSPTAVHQRAQTNSKPWPVTTLTSSSMARSIRWRPAVQDRQRHSSVGLGTALGSRRTDPSRNEPGFSIMPGKVNPTQCEAMTMVCCQVFGNHTTITVAGSQGHFELNVYSRCWPLHDGVHPTDRRRGRARSPSIASMALLPDEKRIKELMERSLMLVTRGRRRSGYDNAAKVAKAAHARGTTLKERLFD